MIKKFLRTLLSTFVWKRPPVNKHSISWIEFSSKNSKDPYPDQAKVEKVSQVVKNLTGSRWNKPQMTGGAWLKHQIPTFTFFSFLQKSTEYFLSEKIILEAKEQNGFLGHLTMICFWDNKSENGQLAETWNVTPFESFVYCSYIAQCNCRAHSMQSSRISNCSMEKGFVFLQSHSTSSLLCFD